MSSSLSSIILIGVVWLLIVTTLFVRRHSPVRKTSKVLSETRVVHEGGSGITRTRRRPLPAESLYHSDPDSEIELVDAEPEQVVIDDTREPVVPSVVDGDVIASYRPLDDHDTGEFAPVSAGDVPDTTVAGDPEVGYAGAGATEDGAVIGALDTDAVPASPLPEGAGSVGHAGSTDAVADADGDTATGMDHGFGHDSETTAEIAAVVDDDTPGAVAAPVVDLVPAAPEATAEREVSGRPRFTVVSEAYVRGGDIDVSVGTDEEPPVAAGAPADGYDDGYDDGTDVGDELTPEDLDFLASRKGRGIYDPVASRDLADRRLRRRRRVLLALALVTVFALAGAVVLSGALWAVVVLAVAVTAAYLYSLRKQTVAEQALQRRRLARMRRARLGVRSTDDRELGVPDRLRRPGAVVVETDDADPLFADLGYADVTFAGYDDYDDNLAGQAPGTGDDRSDDGILSVRVV